MTLVVCCRPLTSWDRIDPFAHGMRRVGHTRVQVLTGPGGLPAWFGATRDAGTYQGRHRRPHALDMTPGMVYFSDPVWRRIINPKVYPDEAVI